MTVAPQGVQNPAYRPVSFRKKIRPSPWLRPYGEKVTFELSKCLKAFSMMMDYAEMEYMGVHTNHSKRVAYISLCLGRTLGLSDRELNDLYIASILHDSGLTAGGLLRGTARYADRDIVYTHCVEGERNLASFPTMGTRGNVILHHHEEWNGSGPFGIRGEEIPFFSRLIHLADAVDVEFDLYHLPAEGRDRVRRFAEGERDVRFSREAADAFLAHSDTDRFWMDLSHVSISDVLTRVAPDRSTEVTWEEMHSISEIMMHIIDSKSEFTYRHSRGIGERTAAMCDYYVLSPERKRKLSIAAHLHDIGKLCIPNAILSKPGPLNAEEFETVKRHAYFTKLDLGLIPGLEEIARWAGNHHEKLNGAGYPERLKGDELEFESRLLGVVDVYQALTEDRPYRPGMPRAEALSILRGMADRGFLDSGIVSDVGRHVE
jgi:HD-GYP domain-containing protein (c-di-GMP phosphodiesterase class II)